MKYKPKNIGIFKQKIKENIQQREKSLVPDKLSVLFTVVNKGKGDFYIDVLEGFGINMHVKVFGRGTAPSHVAELFGLTNTQKDVIISIVPERMVHTVIKKLNGKFTTVKNGNGIALAVPMQSIIGVYVYNFFADNRIK